jgi:cytochrome oxidase assembly protein ShyY1
MTVLVGVLLPLVIGLGVWQLERAQHKRGYQDLFVERTSARPTPPPADIGEGRDLAFMRVRLVGEFDPQRYFLVDNQMDGGRAGYWVVASFRGADGRRWLVNRGWIAAPAQRDQLPRVPVPDAAVATIGAFWPDTGLVPLLDEDPWEGPWPIRVQRLNVARMAQLLENAAPREIRLEAGQPGSLKPLSLKTGFDAQRHRGYAVQWFGLAVALVVGYTVFGFKPR